MITITASNARKGLYRLMDLTTESHKPIIITGKSNNVIMISEEDWRAVEETLYLNSVPDLAKELIERKSDKDTEFIDESDMDW
jgi:PHD/YefM family antitoxin component YafN of YafNO toxin-antitoxin module